MRYSPSQKNPRVTGVFVSLLVFGAAVFAVPQIFGRFGVKISAAPFSVLAFAAIVAAVFFMVKYRMTVVEYVIRPSDAPSESEIGEIPEYAGEDAVLTYPPEKLEFCVYRAEGTRMKSMECLFPLADLVSCEVVSRRESSGGGYRTPSSIADEYKKRGESYVFADYTVTFGLEHALCLVFVSGNGYAGVVIEPDAKMSDYFLSYKGRK